MKPWPGDNMISGPPTCHTAHWARLFSTRALLLVIFLDNFEVTNSAGSLADSGIHRYSSPSYPRQPTSFKTSFTRHPSYLLILLDRISMYTLNACPSLLSLDPFFQALVDLRFD